MQVPPCKCIDFHAERRSRPPNGPATIGLALTLCSSIFRTVPQEPRATTRSPKPHLRNQERTFHVSSLPRINTSRRAEHRRPLLGSARRAGLDGRLLHSSSPPSPGLAHESAEESRRANDGPLAESSQRHRGASRRRFPTPPYGAAAERARVTERVARVYQQRQAASAAVSLRRIASLVPTRPAALSSASACSSVCLQLRPRDGAGNFRLHGASMRTVQRALVEF